MNSMRPPASPRFLLEGNLPLEGERDSMMGDLEEESSNLVLALVTTYRLTVAPFSLVLDARKALAVWIRALPWISPREAKAA